MHITDIFRRDSMTLSFEFFPPRTDAGWDALFQRIADFEALRPSFVSVTYGAGGPTRQQTHTALSLIPPSRTLTREPRAQSWRR